MKEFFILLAGIIGGGILVKESKKASNAYDTAKCTFKNCCKKDNNTEEKGANE